ncbi:MAG: hypothetical protein MUF22_05645 [Chitinispirillaceae bacterium]|jgi:hypothetical protein|nr:hypothetical protein [Chitinispirillaceae bacterium]
MKFWIKRISVLLGCSAFFMLFLTGLASSQSLAWESLIGAAARAATGGILFWIIGIVIADILLKGILSDIEVDKEHLVDGGMLQQIQAIRQKSMPGGTENPFVLSGQEDVK